MTTLPVPKLYWDVFQGALQTKVKRLAKEIAGSLGQPEQPLLKALLTDKVSVYLFEEEGSEFADLPSMRCKHYIASPENSAVLTPCHQPILLGQTTCILHHSQEAVKPTLPVLKTVRDVDTGTVYWINSQNVVDKTDISKSTGFYDADKQTLCIFNVMSAPA